jgi:hypothetical protein
MKIRAVIPRDAAGIARVHEKALPWSINGRLGYAHLKEMYDILISGPDCVGFVAVHDDSIIAFQISSADWKAARFRLANIGWRGKLRVVATCLRHPYDLIALFEAVFLIPPAFRRTGIRAELMAWAAEPENALAAVGATRCLMQSIAELLRRGEIKCLGQMQKPNERPMQALNRLSPAVFASYIRNDVLVFDCKRGGKIPS